MLQAWSADRKAGAVAIQKHVFQIRTPLANNKLQDARNLMYVNELYSDSTIAAFDRFVRICIEWITRATFPPERGEKIKAVSRDELNEALEQVKNALRAELTPFADARSDPPVATTNKRFSKGRHQPGSSILHKQYV